MPSDSAGRRLPEPESARLGFSFEGEAVEARAGDSVAAALLAAGQTVTRTTPVTGSPRGPFCMMGVCFECLLEIDGEPNRQGCMVPVRAGMTVRRMAGARPLERSDGDDLRSDGDDQRSDGNDQRSDGDDQRDAGHD